MTIRSVRLGLSFKWYDLWIGAYWSRQDRCLYVCPMPCVVLSVAFGRSEKMWGMMADAAGGE